MHAARAHALHAREQWGSRLEFILALVGMCVGVGNIWRFPFLCYRNGGSPFLLPYLIALATVGVPVFLLELAIGQLFRHYNVLPCFTLLNAGRNSEGFWRLYDLDSKIARCNIREEFRGDTFELHLPASMRSGLYGRWTASTGAPEEEL